MSCLTEPNIATLGSFDVLRDLRISTETNERWLTLNEIFAVCSIYHEAKNRDNFVNNISKIFKIVGVEYRTRTSGTLYATQFSVPSFYFGLQNPNVRCYLNVAVIACWKIPLLRQQLSQQEHAVARELKLLFIELDEQKNSPKTDALKSALKLAGKWQKGHQDAAEALYYFLEIAQMPTDIGITYSSSYYYNGQEISKRTNEFETGFNLSVNKNTSVQEEINAWQRPTDVQFNLDGTSIITQKTCKLILVNSILFVNINRFSEDFTKKKCNTITLNEQIKINGEAFALHMVISHQGSAMEGHYRILVNENVKMVWNEYDDNRVLRRTRSRLHELRGGNHADASFLVYVKQTRVKDLFPVITTASGNSLPRTRGRTVSVAFEVSGDEDSLPRTKRRRRNIDVSVESNSADDNKATNDEAYSHHINQSNTDANFQMDSPFAPSPTPRAPTKNDKSVTIGNPKDLTLESYEVLLERVTRRNIICVYKVRQQEGERQWLVQWSITKSKSINWVSASRASKGLQAWLNTFFKSPNAQKIQGWQDPVALPVYRPQKTFEYARVGPTTNASDKMEIFCKFIDDDLIATMVTEMNRAARRTFDEANLERQLWKLSKCQSLTEWGQQMEKKYPTLRSNDTWNDKTRTLQKYFSSTYIPTLKDRINYYKEQSKWKKDTNVQELKTFIALMLAIRCIRGRRARDYFCTVNPMYGNEFIASMMSQKRYEVLWNHFHIDVDFLIENIVQKCERNWTPSQKVTFDETIVHFLGRFYALQHIPSKPHPNGVLLYLLADASKYVWTFDFFLGLCLPPQYQLLEIADKLSKLQKGYTIITDSHWGSEEVATILDGNGSKFLLSCKRDHPSYLFGEFCDSLKNSAVGSFRQLVKPGSSVPITAMTYKDSNACINLLSNYINDSSYQIMPCNGIPQSKGKPLIVREYTYAKGYVDEVARQLHTFDWPHKVKRWPIIIWNTLLNICCWNSFVYHQTNEVKRTTYRDYLRDLAVLFATKQRRGTSELVRPRTAKGALLKHTLGNRHIRVCRSELKQGLKSRRPCVFCKLKKKKPTETSKVCLGCSRTKWRFRCDSCECKHSK